MHNIFRNFIASQWCLKSTCPSMCYVLQCAAWWLVLCFGCSSLPQCECCRSARKKENCWNTAQHFNLFYVYKMSYQQYNWNINLHQKSQQNGFQMSVDQKCLDSQKWNFSKPFLATGNWNIEINWAHKDLTGSNIFEVHWKLLESHTKLYRTLFYIYPCSFYCYFELLLPVCS